MKFLGWHNLTDAMNWLMLLGRLLTAAGLGVFVTWIYRWTQPRDAATNDSFITTLALLTLLTAMSTQVIGDSVARAFSLVGALSIVRFRTAVQDTRDTAFVICAVVVGMAIGAGHAAVALTGLPLVAVLAYALRPPQAAPQRQERKRNKPLDLETRLTSYSQDLQEASR